MVFVTAQPQPQPNSTSTRVGVDKVISWTTHPTPPFKFQMTLHIFGPNMVAYRKSASYVVRKCLKSLFLLFSDFNPSLLGEKFVWVVGRWWWWWVVVQLITLSTPTRVEVELGWGCGWAVTKKNKSIGLRSVVICVSNFVSSVLLSQPNHNLNLT